MTHELLTNARTKHFFASLRPTRRLVDVGAGIHPCVPFQPKKHIIIEPFHEYCDALVEQNLANNAEVWLGKARLMNAIPRRNTTVLLLDVIEHMEREEGECIKALAEEFEQAVVFTPLGYMAQSGENPDCWGMNGGHWQKHRSGWTAEDFPGWEAHELKGFDHGDRTHGHERNFGALLAIWKKFPS